MNKKREIYSFASIYNTSNLKMAINYFCEKKVKKKKYNNTKAVLNILLISITNNKSRILIIYALIY